MNGIVQQVNGSNNDTGHTIASGEYFIANGVKYKATAAIPNGEPWSGSASAVSGNDIVNDAVGSLNSKFAEYGNLGVSTVSIASATSAELDTGTFTFGLLVGYYRSNSDQERSGYAIVYMYSNTAYICAKTGLSVVTGVSYANNKLTVSSTGGYMTYAFIKLL